MKATSRLLLVPILILVCGNLPATAAERPPNILLIFSDDHGWADLGIQGVDKDVRTPHLDQLARDGVRFTRGYITAPQCTPSRAALLTGRYQNRFGVEHNGLAMKSKVVTLPERLKEAGYVTGMSGKWHLDVESGERGKGKRKVTHPELAPRHQGFDEYFTGSMQDYSASHALDGTAFPDAPRRVSDPRCRVVIQTEAALAFLKRRAAQPDQPWFHYLAYMAPHVPLEYPEPWFSQTPEHLPKTRRSALALIAAIDDGVGRIRTQLAAMGQEKNTLIFFIGDNGAPLGEVWDGSINLPMRGQKGMLSEGGIRVPFVAAWPGKIPGGQTFEQPVISLDVAATALAQNGKAHGAKLDGVNLLPFLNGAKKGAPHETLFWRWMSQAAVQEFPHKLVALGGKGTLLFDITTPEGETFERDLSAQRPEVAARLLAKLRAWTGELQPPGMPPALADRHVQLFADAGISDTPGGVAPKKEESAPEGTIQGWLARGGTLAVRDSALVISRSKDAGAKTAKFITRAGLDLAGPVAVTLRVRAKSGGPSAITWRTKAASFAPDQSATFEWPTSDDWREIKVELPEKGRVLHVRIAMPSGASGLEVQSIELRGREGQPLTTDFASAK